MSFLDSPREYYAGLAVTSINDVLNAPDLPLAIIKKTIGLIGARAVVALALAELITFFNVGNSMNDEQVALTTDLILEEYWYFKIEDIKYCFRKAMRTAQIYGRIDGNIIFQWLREYNYDRCEKIEEIEINKNNAYKSDQVQSSGTGVSFEQYVAGLEAAAANGDKEAEENLENARHWQAQFARPTISEKDWKEYYRQYRINKTIGKALGNENSDTCS